MRVIKNLTDLLSICLNEIGDEPLGDSHTYLIVQGNLIYTPFGDFLRSGLASNVHNHLCTAPLDGFDDGLRPD